MADYFVETAEYLKAFRGEVNVVAGRKGSGKTAIFFMVRNAIRPDELSVRYRPEAGIDQLSLFREKLLEQVGQGLFDHTVAAFWYFVLLTEIILTIKRQYDYRAKYDSRALGCSNQIRDLLAKFGISEKGDFTLRLNRLEEHLLKELASLAKSNRKMGPDALTNLIFRGGIAEIKTIIVDHTDTDLRIVLLFDNIDKGWPTNGVQDFDVRLVRLLVETLDKIKRDFGATNREFASIVFLRNDVYELMVDATPDRGKAGQARIDWTDKGSCASSFTKDYNRQQVLQMNLSPYCGASIFRRKFGSRRRLNIWSTTVSCGPDF